MKKNNFSYPALAFIVLALALVYFSSSPFWMPKSEAASEFSTKRAMGHIKAIAGSAHYVGTRNHSAVRDYLVSELEKLGLKPQIQEGTTLTEWGNLVKSKNIVARIKGTENGKALLLVSHYDSAPHSFSKGASDDASGVATVLEGVRAFLSQNKSRKNDIIVLFSDAEELGLNGAALFVSQHPWAKNIGLAINFEARGTAGPSYMLMEVNHGNEKLVREFQNAAPKLPVSNSLMYSIYKLLPNDTDLTVFREKGQIPGFNFAFIDNHFNYHTAQDSYANLSQASLNHQSLYLMPLLHHFSNADLRENESDNDLVYFNIPFYFISYPFSWVLNMTIGASIFFVFLVFIGLGKKIIVRKHLFNGFVNLFGASLTVSLFSYFGWKILLNIYPDYQDILQGFTYNGHLYIAAFSFIALAIAFLFYSNSNSVTSNLNQMIAPLLIWLFINFGISLYLPGAGFFIIPICFGLLMLAYFVLTQKTNLFLNLVFALPSLFIFAPLIMQLPVGLGLKMLAASNALLLLVFCLLIPVFGVFTNKKGWASFFLLAGMIFFGLAHVFSGFDANHKKPNSLLYVLNADTNKARYLTYNKQLDAWNKKYVGEALQNDPEDRINELFSKYGTPVTYARQAAVRPIPKPSIVFLKDSIAGQFRHLKIKIQSNRLVNRYDILANNNMKIYRLRANGAASLDQNTELYQRSSTRVLSHYVTRQEPLILEFYISKNTPFDMELLESSFDLLSNPLLDVQPRSKVMMPMPFVLTDAVVVQMRIRPATTSNSKMPATTSLPKVSTDSTAITVDTLRTE